jgi:hypothetical protein
MIDDRTPLGGHLHASPRSAPHLDDDPLAGRLEAWMPRAIGGAVSEEPNAAEI